MRWRSGEADRLVEGLRVNEGGPATPYPRLADKVQLESAGEESGRAGEGALLPLWIDGTVVLSRVDLLRGEAW